MQVQYQSQMMLKLELLDIPLTQELQVLSLQMQLPVSSVDISGQIGKGFGDVILFPELLAWYLVTEVMMRQPDCLHGTTGGDNHAICFHTFNQVLTCIA